ncbi:branched-chain amino acid ABC transporter permease [Thermus sp.]|uniref:branched-chain amino acid ABC transporter permease n=1 Tax=Thermus sp. TaxID=275 RepID=UPI00307F77A8
MAFLETLISASIFGGVYALLALGLTLQYGVARVLNLAYGEAVVLAGIAAALLFARGLSPLWTLLFLPPLWMALHLLLFRFLFLPVLGPRLALDPGREGRVILLSFGLSFLSQGLMAAYLGGQLFSCSYLQEGVALGPAQVSLNRILAFLLAMGMAFGLHFFLQRSRLGTAIRALSREPEEAALVGVPVPRLAAWVFALGGGLAGAVGVLLSTFQPLSPTLGPELTLKALVVVVLGGLGGVPGALAGGVALGLTEGLVARFLSPGLSLAVLYLLFLGAVLYLRSNREVARQ